jgi:hypothetical protein
MEARKKEERVGCARLRQVQFEHSLGAAFPVSFGHRYELHRTEHSCGFLGRSAYHRAEGGGKG